ncbi:hypothetical protein ASG40_12760 [Methylobacterium sp. Leaf399]|uniref:hypothetical protein n=1 Tax=unclassified Methylobacterium TaxID=2615210 RepID=UPI0006F2FB33|nr:MULTISPECIES: hypothetical protein [unclassified Methylobacterium]KQT07778.1 hypothetical protein ASG40_12760 [Methylobacterium sp. Leaf399]KQT88892.1 hypothetical protein ASG59_13525 [Methylobacterium sp. Leaf466]
MPWYAIRPRDAADPRWPLPQSPVITLKAADPDEARARFLEAYPSRPFGTPGSPVADAGEAGLHEDDSLVIEPCDAPAAPDQP